MTNHFLSPRSFARAAILAFVCLFSSATEAITSSVGSTPGSFAVSPSGAASYTIPIAVPPGTAGMEPKLALTYNSQGGNGLLGMGWSVSGLSAIHRCAATVAQDGFRGGINYNKYDRYCLDGKRLVRTDGYSEPKPGSGLVTHAGVIFGTYITEYSLETDPSIRIVATAYDSLRIPVHFSVYTKSGQILEFGVTPDSRIEAQGKISVSVWALNKVQDTVGNYLTVTYFEDNANGQYYPTRIDYTGNASRGLTPYNSVQFTYEARPDITPMYHAGSLKQSTVRLKNVQAYSGVGLVKDYRLAYDVSATTSRSRLIGLTECAGDGVCLPSTVIGHGSDPAASSFTDGGAWRTGWCGVGLESEFGAADFNADGKTDIWCHAWATGTTYVALSNGAGAFTGGSVWHSNWCIAGNIFLKPKIEIGDFNGDSKADLACSRQGVGSVTPILSNGVSAFLDDGVFYSDGFPSIGAADFNGDGTGDFFTHGGVSGGVYLGNSRIALSNTVGAFSDSTVWRSGWCPAEGGSYAGPGDFNGDGKADIWCRDPGTGDISVVLSDGISTLTNGNNGLVWKPGWCGQSSQFGTGDFNGDGKADIFCHDPGAASTSVGLSDGIGKFVDGGVWKAGWCGSGSFFGTGDFNGDGKTDIYCQDSVGSIYIALSNGAGAFPYGNAWRANWCAGTSIVPGDFNGDGKTDMACRVPSGNTSVALSGSMATPPDLLATITTGLGAVTTITYKPLTDNSVYIKEPGSNYPTLDIQAPLYVVSTSSTSNGIGGTRNTNYIYGGAKADLSGRGLLGFRWMQATDQDTGIRSYTAYSQTYPYIGMPIQIQRSVNGVVLNDSAATLAAIPLGGQRYFPYVARNVEQSFEANGAFISSATTDSVYDSFGNPTQIVVSTGDGYTKTTNNTYTNDATNWFLGRLTLATVTSATPSGSLTRTSGFAYNPANGLLTQEVIEPNNPALRLQTDYTYDSYGNKLTVTVSGSGIATRTTSTVFDTKGQFPTRTTNALGHSDNGTYDAGFGKPASLTGPNGLTTTWSYDGFGRKVNETRADGTQTNVAFKLCDASCPSRAKFYVSLAKYYVVTTSAGSPTSYAYFDILNREIRAQVQGFDGRLITKDTFYDSLGRVDRVTKPYYAGDSVLYSRYQYDALGRVIQETAPDNSTRKVAYNGLITTATNALSQTEIKTKNSQGQLVSVRDNLGNLISYQYDPFSNLTKTTDPKGNVISLTYDLRGRKIGMVDPDMGSWTYTYNVLGELTQQRDAKLQTVNISYDLLGRMLTRSEPDLNSTWVYDTAVKGIGKLKQVSSDNGFLRVVTYDSLGRAASETSTIDAAYTVAKSYDAYGRVSVFTYPTGVAIKNIYNAYGYLSEVRNNANQALFWKANAKDADGNVLNETLGNGLTTTRTYTDTTGRVQAIATTGASAVQNQSFTFDFVGNLKARTDSVTGVTESFGYDGLNRLTSVTQGAVTTTVAYDSIGNITNKSDVGNYTYGAKPHAVTQVAGALNASYTYDANGNLESGAGREVSYTSYNLPSQMAGANGGAFLYDADHTRITQYSSATTIYLNPRIDTGMHFEKEIKNGVPQNKHYIYGAAGVVGVYTTQGAGPDTIRKTRYFHQDHLGSIVAVTDDNAVVVARYAFDAWGKRLTQAGDPQATHHGFTGHEHLDDMGLIHMNGRVYDPALARFMSADPNVQAPDNLQSYNRYSYVLNNPLSYTDPSGFSWWTDFRDDVIKPVVTIVIAYYAWTYVGLLTGSEIAAGAAGGFAGGYVGSGGDLGAGIMGGFTGGAMGAVGNLWPNGWENIAGHAGVGCASSVMSGGKCGSGALAGGFSAAAAPYIQDSWGPIGGAMASAVVGGTASVLGGGKFGNGAMTGAFGYLFNCWAHECYASDYSNKKPRHQYGAFESPVLCNVSNVGCMRASERELSCNSAPGQGACIPIGKVVSGDLTGDNIVTQYRPNDGIIINGTLDGHRYHDGYVVRWLGVNPAGDVTIWTFGLGVNTSTYMATENQLGGVLLFQKIGIENSMNVKKALGL